MGDLGGTPRRQHALEGSPHSKRFRPIGEQVVVEDTGRPRVRQDVDVALHQVSCRKGPVRLCRACNNRE